MNGHGAISRYALPRHGQDGAGEAVAMLVFGRLRDHDCRFPARSRSRGKEGRTRPTCARLPLSSAVEERVFRSTACAVSANFGWPVVSVRGGMDGSGARSCVAFEEHHRVPNRCFLPLHPVDWTLPGWRDPRAVRDPYRKRAGIRRCGTPRWPHHGAGSDKDLAGNPGKRRIRYTGREASEENFCGHRFPHR